MKRPRFVRVIGAPEPNAGDTHEFRRQGDIIKIGSIVPVQWFKTTPDAVFIHLINPPEAGGMGVIEEYEPSMKELAVLREFYPGAFPTEPHPQTGMAHHAPTEVDKTDSPVQALTPDPSPSGRGEAKTRTSKKHQEDGE